MATAPGQLMQDAPAHLGDYLAVIRSRKWSIVAVMAAFIVLSVVYAKQQPPSFRSVAKVLVLQPSTTNPADPGSITQQAGKPINLQTEAEIVSSTAVAQLAKQQLPGAPQGAQELLKNVTASFTTDSQVLSISFTGKSRRGAQEGAQAFAAGYLQYKKQQFDQAVLALRSTLNQQLSQLNTALVRVNRIIALNPRNPARVRDAQTQKDLLIAQYRAVQGKVTNLGSTVNSPGQIVGAATLPAGPSNSKYAFLAIGVLLGLAFGLGQAFLRDSLDKRLEGVNDLEERLDAPVFAVIPRIRDWRRRGLTRTVMLEEPRSPAAEAYRTLRTGLMFVCRENGSQAIMVTSASAGEGKSATAVNLSIALAQADNEVILVSADLRRPRSHVFLHAPSSPGLSELLMGRGAPAQVLVGSGVPGLRFLPGGQLPDDPTELLGSPTMEGLLAHLKRMAAYVVIDAPPLIVSDPLIMAAFVDGILFVADAGSAHGEVVTHVTEQLHHVGGKILGGVLNDFDVTRAKGYAPRYGYSSYEEPETDRTPRPLSPGPRPETWTESASLPEVGGNGSLSRAKRPLRTNP
jgi:capsular exopolysaccharide synthesis family protein